jgi:hypothetical protein
LARHAATNILAKRSDTLVEGTEAGLLGVQNCNKSISIVIRLAVPEIR